MFMLGVEPNIFCFSAEFDYNNKCLMYKSSTRNMTKKIRRNRAQLKATT